MKLGDKIQSQVKICPSCKGSGSKVVDEQIVNCSTCKGEGIVSK